MSASVTIERSPRGLIARYAYSVMIACGVTFSLLWIMQQVIKSDETNIADPGPTVYLDMYRHIEEQPLPGRPPRPEPPVKAEPEPKPPRLQLAVFTPGGEAGTTVITPPVVDTDPGSAGADGDMLPIMTVAPEYPTRALSQGLEGWVIVEFSVDHLGRVVNPRVINSQPGAQFNRAAIKAVQRYKYKPRVVNGKPTTVHGVRHRIVFNLTA